MRLFYRDMGSGEPLFILHGLYGSSDNWVSVGRELANDYRVIIVDQRNHGQSPHAISHTYNELANDLFELVQPFNYPKINVLGHSMGGKTAILFTKLHQQMVKSLVVVDIAPGSYAHSQDFSTQEKTHSQIISALLSLDTGALTSRQQADEMLSLSIKDNRIRQFLLKNLKRDQIGNFSWSINLESLSNNIHQLMDSVLDDNDAAEVISVPSLFIRGALSTYILPSHADKINKWFTNPEIVTIPESGHWVHAEQPKQFLEALKIFLKKTV